MIDGATNKYIDDGDDDDEYGAARRLSPRLEASERAREEIGATIASFGFCTIIYLFMKRIYSIYDEEIHREIVKALALHYWEVHL